MFSTGHLHPMMVHFPIALLLLGFVFEICSLLFKKETCWSFAGFWLLIAGTLGALAAFGSGLLFTSELTGTAGKIKQIHEILAGMTVLCALVDSGLKIYLKLSHKENDTLKWISFGFYAFSAILVIITGFYGGNLVYTYMLPL